MAGAIGVAGLTDYIKSLLEDDLRLKQVWVVGEVSSANHHASGLFFTLKDGDCNETVNCVVWRSQQSRLASLPKAGDQVTILGSIRLYPQRSSYQLMVWQVLPAGDGLQALRYRQLKQRLAAEGLFDPEFKPPLPLFPQVIAVVTSAQAAAWGDIQRSLRQHHPGLQVLFSPATVQGELAPDSIVSAIQRVVADNRAEVLILARGGGATEDLDCFNDERVVRAVATCPIPVVTGIGHQRDESLADLAATVCAHTPTAAAITAVPALVELIDAHQARLDRLQGLVDRQLSDLHTWQYQLKQRLNRIRLDQILQYHRSHTNQLKQRLVRDIHLRLQQATNRISVLEDQLTSLDPEAVLRRGYALVRTGSGQVITGASQVKLHQTLEIQLAQGELTVEVTGFSPQTPNPQQE